MCTPMKLDKSNTNYLVGFEPTAHKDTAHHMILYGCKSPARQEAIYNCGGMEYHMDYSRLPNKRSPLNKRSHWNIWEKHET